MELIHPDWPAPPWVRAVASTRLGGVSATPYDALNLGAHCGDDPAAVRRNRVRWMRAAGLPRAPAWLDQVHGTAVAVEPEADVVPRADVAVSERQDRPLAVMTADCLPILLCALDRPWIAVVHAGWRGLVDGVIAAAHAHAPPGADLIAWIGPSIRPAHYEVDAAVRDPLLASDECLESHLRPVSAGRWLADLPGIALHQLKTLGTKGFDSRLDTFQDPRRFYSYRRDHGQTGRQVCMIWMQDAP